MRSLRVIAMRLVVLLAVTSIIATIYIAGRQTAELQREELGKIALIAEATRRMSDLSIQYQDYSFILEIIQRNETVPVVLTNGQGYPISIRNVPEEYVVHAERLPRLLKELAQEHEPIIINLPSGEENRIYYGSSATLKELRYYPYVQLLFIGVVVLLGYLILRQTRQVEQNRIWVGLAKETAHQLGTPISSLLAWTHMLEEDKEYEELTESLRMDVDRLERIADRFSKIGATPQLNDYDIASTISQSLAYMRPRISKRIRLLEDLPTVSPKVPHNAVLLQWVLENLIRNAVDAIAGEGVIAVRLSCEQNYAYIDCSDSGKGMSRRVRRQVFLPGYSTKLRGWGLGLSLARRIVHDYHHGRIFVQRSEPNRGTTFRAVLPILEERRMPLLDQLKAIWPKKRNFA